VSRSASFAHIVRHEDGSSSGVWGGYTLQTAFQPIFAFGEGGKLSLAAFEGLIRPQRDGAPVPPPAFFSNMASSDRMHVETLTRTIHLLNAGVFLDPSSLVFVNFDPSLFSDRMLTERILREMRLVLHEAGIEPSRIVCEVTEQRTSSDTALFQFVQALRDNGYLIAVDDYGSEDSSIQRINDLEPDIVKFDAQWITRLMNSRPGNALLEAMVADFRAKGIINLFEGIEEPWQLELAEKCGVDMVQGYVLARPEIVPVNFAMFPSARFFSEPARHFSVPVPARRKPASRRVFGHRVSD